MGEVAMTLRARFYILNEHDEPVPVADAIDWALWFEANTDRRIVLRDTIGEACVSTVFLGLDHSYRDDLPLKIYETLVFDGQLGGEMDRYATRDEAIVGHAAMCDRVRQAST